MGVSALQRPKYPRRCYYTTNGYYYSNDCSSVFDTTQDWTVLVRTKMNNVTDNIRFAIEKDANDRLEFYIPVTQNTKEVIGLIWKSNSVSHLFIGPDVVLSNSVRLTRVWRYNSATKVVTQSCPDSPMPYVQADYAITGTPVNFPSTTRIFVASGYTMNGFCGPFAAWNRRISDSELTYAMTDLWQLEELFAGDMDFKAYYKMNQKTLTTVVNYAPNPVCGNLGVVVAGDGRYRFSPLEM